MLFTVAAWQRPKPLEGLEEEKQTEDKGRIIYIYIYNKIHFLGVSGKQTKRKSDSYIYIYLSLQLFFAAELFLLMFLKPQTKRS